MTGLATPCLCLVLLAAVGPLSDQNRDLLATASDRDPTADSPALFALLQDAWTWPRGDQAGAAVPDYAAILADPAAARGSLFLIEGRLMRARKIAGLARPGPWDGSLSEWTIQWGQTPLNVVVVDLVDPPPPPELGEPVRLAGRFYKLWRVEATQGPPSDFLLFVGRDFHTAAAADRPGSITRDALLLAIGIAAGVLLARLLHLTARFSTKPVPPTAPPPDDDDPALDDQNLPADPAEALRELHRRQSPRNSRNPRDPLPPT